MIDGERGSGKIRARRPLCNSAIIFDRRLDGKTYTFGVSGMLRNSDMVITTTKQTAYSSS